MKRRWPALRGRRVFAVEDEFPILLQLESMLAELGLTVAASALRLSEALEAARTVDADVAVLDVNLGGEAVYPVAEALVGRGVTVVFATGYGVGGVPDPWRARPIMQKPYRLDELGRVLAEALAPSAAASADPQALRR